jgi:hypothetical protein
MARASDDAAYRLGHRSSISGPIVTTNTGTKLGGRWALTVAIVETDFNIRVDFFNQTHDAFGTVFLHITLPPRLEPLEAGILLDRFRVRGFPECGVDGQVELDGEVLVRDRVLNVSDGAEERGLVNGLDPRQKFPLDEGDDDIRRGRDADLEADPGRDDTFGAESLEDGVACNGSLVVSRLQLRLTDGLDAVVDLLGREGPVVDRGVVDEFILHGRVGIEDVGLEGGEEQAIARLPVRDPLQTAGGGGQTCAKDGLGVLERHAADQMTALRLYDYGHVEQRNGAEVV